MTAGGRAKSALFVCGRWEGYEVDISRTLDLLVQARSMGKISDEQERGLLEVVKSGVGLADSFPDNMIVERGSLWAST